MAINSLSGSDATTIIFGINQASRRVGLAAEHISLNSRLTRAGDDVGALSVATRLNASLAGRRAALVNNTQADSLLQVAYGGLSTISDILTSMKSLATQANAGGLTPAQLANLDAQFQQYGQEIDSIATSTNFNSIKLLDGSINDENAIGTKTNAATQATGTLNFAVNIGAGQTVRLNGVTFTEGVNFAAAGTIAGTIDNLVVALQSSTNTAISQASYGRVGNTLTITHKSGGTLGNQFLINQNASTAAFTTVGASTNVANLYTLQGGTNNGLNLTSVRATGTIGDTLVNTQSQSRASVRLSITGAIANGEQLRIDNGNGGTVNFNFAAAAVAATDIQIGATTQDTIANAVAVISRYTATDDYGVRQLEVTRDGTDLVLTSKASGNPADLAGAVLDISETLANGSLSAATFASGTNTGINAEGVNNASFVGTISGFSATYNSGDNVTAQVTVGGVTYSATVTDTTPAANTVVRFSSTGGGYFDVQLAGGAGTTVTNQADADIFAARLDAAFSTLSFYQNRISSSFVPAGQLANASAEFQLKDFSDVTLENVSVTAPAAPGLDAVIDLTINGQTFRSASGLGGILGDYENLVFTNLADGNQKITLRNGSTTIDLSNQANADTFEASLKTAFGFGTGGGSLSFQLGESSADKLNIRISSAKTSALYNGATPDLTTQPNAVAAEIVIDAAIDTVTGLIASVGAYQSRVGYASDSLSSSITALDEARSVLEDADIAQESTNLASATAQQQAAIYVLAQTSGLRSDLLTLLKPAA